MTETTAALDTIDVIARPSAALARARLAKPEGIGWIQAADDELFGPDSATAAVGTFDVPRRRRLAARVAGLLGSAALLDHHLAHLDDSPAGDAAWEAVLTFADAQTLTPALVTAEDIASLTAYWGPDDILVIAQTVAFTSFQARYVAGIELLSGRSPAVPPTAVETPPVSIGRAKSRATVTGDGRPRPIEYTRDLLSWTPWVPPVAEADLTPEQADAFAGKTNVEYFRLLARAPRLLKARTQSDLAIFYTRDGLPKAERELAAAVVSKINDCIYCASVHARKAAQLSRRTEDVDRLLAADLDRDELWRPTDLAPLAAGQDDRWSAVITFAAGLALHPHRLTPEAVEPLRRLGLSDLDLLDLVGAVAFFSWANRLMLTLGEPYVP